MSALRDEWRERPMAAAAQGPVSFGRIFAATFVKFRRHYVLFLAVFALCMGSGALIAALLRPEYTATAVIGPAPSPLSGDISEMSGGVGGALGASITKKLGMIGGGGADLFDQYTELLTSSRLAAKLSRNGDVTRGMLYERYDWEAHRWKARHGVWGWLVTGVKRLFHYPVSPVPGPDDLQRFLKNDVTVNAPLTSNFVTVSLTSDSPEKAQWLLDVVLMDADSLIREDKRRDVAARVAYLNEVLPTVVEVLPRETLTRTLSDQEQTMMVIHADKRYASALVDPPHASRIPSFPSLWMTFGTAFVLALAVWGVLVSVLPDHHPLLRRFTIERRMRSWREERMAAE